jgi:apolipoprotein N-acyltransferase
MKRDAKAQDRGKSFFGLMLIGLGIVLLLGQLGMLDVPRIWHWWPAILIVIGLGQVIASSNPRQAASGVSLILFGLWFFACLEHWYGLRFRNAWPILLVIFGFESVVTALLERGRKGAQPS